MTLHKLPSFHLLGFYSPIYLDNGPLEPGYIAFCKLKVREVRKQLTAFRLKKTSSCSKNITHINFVLPVSSSYQLYHCSFVVPWLPVKRDRNFVARHITLFNFPGPFRADYTLTSFPGSLVLLYKIVAVR